MSRNANVGITLSLGGAGAVVNGLQGVTQSIGAMSDATQRSITTVAQLGGAFLVFEGVARSLSGATAALDAFTTAASRIDLVSHSLTASAKAQAEVFKVAQDARVEYASLAEVYTKLARSAGELHVSQDRLLGVTRSISQAMTISGGRAESMNAALLQLSQGLASGTLRGEELNSVLEQAPRLAQAIAEGMGKGIGELRALGEAGKITATEIIQALEKEAPKLAAEFARMTPTLTSAFQVLKDGASKAFYEFDKGSGISASLATAMIDLAKGLGDAGSAAKEFGEAYGGAIKTVAEIGAIVAATSALGSLVGKLGTLIRLAANPIVIGVTLAVGTAKAVDAAQTSESGISYALDKAQGRLAEAEKIRDRYGYGYKDAPEENRRVIEASMAFEKKTIARLQGELNAVRSSAAAEDPAAKAARALRQSDRDWEKENTVGGDAPAWSGAKPLEEVRKYAKTRYSIIAEWQEKTKNVVLAYDRQIASASADEKNGLLAERNALLGQLEKDNRKALAGIQGSGAKKSAPKNELARQYSVQLDAEKDFAKAQIDLVKFRVDQKVITEEQGIEETLIAQRSGLEKQAALLTEQLAKTKGSVERSAIERQIGAIGYAAGKAGEQYVSAMSKIDEATRKYRNSALTDLDNNTFKIGQENEKLQEQLDTLGLSSAALITYKAGKLDAAAAAEQLAAANLREAASQAEASGAAQADIAYYRDLADARQAAAEALSQGADLSRQVGAKTIAVDQAKESAEAWKKFGDDIERGLTDSLYRAFEAGKGFGETFVDSLKTLFKTTVLKIAVQGVVQGVSGAVGLGGGSSGTQQGSNGSTTGGFFQQATEYAKTASNAWDTVGKAYDWFTGASTAGGVAGMAGALGSGVTIGTAAGVGGTAATAAGMTGALGGGITATGVGGVVGGVAGGVAGGVGGAAGMAGALGGGIVAGGAGGVVGGVGGAAAASTLATTAAAVVPVVGWIVAAAGLLYSVFGNDGPGKSQGAASYGALTNGAVTKTAQGEGSADKYAAGYQPSLDAINTSFLGAIGALGDALGQQQDVQFYSAAKARGDGKQYSGFGLNVNGGAEQNFVWSFAEDDKEAMQKMASHALGEVLVKAIQDSSFSAPIKGLFAGMTDATLTVQQVQNVVALTKASEQLNSTWGLTIDQAAEVSAVMSDGTEQSRVNAVAVVAQAAAAQKAVSSSLAEAYQSLSAPFAAITNGPLPTTLKSYDEAMKAIDKTAQDGIASFARLFSLRGSFAAFTAAIDGIKAALGASIDSLRTSGDIYSRRLATLSDASADAGIDIPFTASELVALADGIDYTTESGIKLALALPSVVAAFGAVHDAIDPLVSRLSTAFRDAQTRIKEESGKQRATDVADRRAGEAAATDMAKGVVSSLSASFESLQKAQSQSGPAGGSINGLHYSAAEYETLGGFVDFLGQASAALDEIARSPLASTLTGYTAEILALTKQVKGQVADQLFSSRMFAGDLDGAMAALLSRTELSFEKFISGGKFNAGAFNSDLELRRLDAGKTMAEFMSANALKLQNAGASGFSPESVSQETRAVLKREAAKEMGLAGNAALTELLSGALDSIVNGRLTERYSPRGPGVASVSYAQANYESASQTKYVAGRLVMGSGAIALAEGLEKLDRAFSAGSLKLADYNKGLDALHAALGDTIPDINDARLGAGAAAMQMAFAGMESVAFYFGQIGEEVSRLAAAAKEAAAPVALVSGSIGRMNSAMSVFGQSAGAWMGGALGMMGAAQAIMSSDSATDEQMAGARELLGRGASIRDEALNEGSQYRSAVLVSTAAGIASSVLTTQSAADAAKKLAEKTSFAEVGATKLRDVSLLLDGLSAFDSVALEGVFSKLAAALSTKQITEAQFADLFNLGITTFTGELDDLTETFGRLRDVSKSLADALLVSEMTTLDPSAKLGEARRQYDDTLVAARGGDQDAVAKLDGVTRTLLDVSKVSASNYGDYALTFASVIRDLRDLEGLGASTVSAGISPRLRIPAFAAGGQYNGGLALVGEAGPELINFNSPGYVVNARQTAGINAGLVEEIRALRAELAQLRADNNAGNAAVAAAAKRTAKVLEKFDADGMPAVAT